MNRRRILTLGGGLLASSIGARTCFGQARYPERPIKLIVPFPPGGIVDPIARLWADRVKPHLGTVVIENLGGGAGAIGTAEAARAEPDGYTAVLGLTGTMVIGPAMAAKALYNPVRDFMPVSSLAISSNVIAINPSIPAKNLKEFIVYAKENGNKLSYGSAGAATITNLVGELFKQLIDAPGIVHIPYKGAGPGISDLVSGHIGMVTVGINGQLLELHRAGKIRILAVTSERRLQVAPEIPTAIEAGLPGMVADVFTALFVPIKTPRPILEQIYQASQKVMTDPSVQNTLIAQGLQPIYDSSPDKTLAYLQSEIVRWTPIIEKLGLKQN